MVTDRLTKEQVERTWKMAYRLNDNVKTYMDNVYAMKKGVITQEDIENLEKYKIDSWNIILRNITVQ